jgi:hypothetical protein
MKMFKKYVSMVLLFALATNCVPIICTNKRPLSEYEKLVKGLKGRIWVVNTLCAAIRRSTEDLVNQNKGADRALCIGVSLFVLGCFCGACFALYKNIQEDKMARSKKIEAISEHLKKISVEDRDKHKAQIEKVKAILVAVQRQDVLIQQLDKVQPYLQKMSVQDQEKFRKEWILKGLEDLSPAQNA